MKFGLLLKKYLIRGKTGQFVIKLAGEDHLCKVYIEDGNAVYISMGTRKPHDILKYIIGKKLEATNFIDGVPPLKRLDEPLNDKLLMLVADEQADQTLNDINVEGPVPSQGVDTLLDDFIDIVGPLGTVIADKVFSDIEYNRGSEMSGEDYSALLSALLNEIPEKIRESFKNKHL
ncbi:hypothetical protein BMS3Abin07_00264 [bacterium BMS3Abin07]|nr:hypothetical protein BMS3Abin07_00264 [bacterium BMS3Abin07]GBE32296.1 hypothetical protein BMS3Bbin05_01206 [bacterium BMS3Bbin05]